MEKSTSKTEFHNVDEYIAMFPENIQDKLKELRELIREIAPETEEIISYKMPTFRLNGILLHFAAYKNHIGFYPTPSGIAEFKDELSSYKHAKGSVQFPIDEPLPINLIRKMVAFRVKENNAKTN
ncbi:Uncharacterized conserved protein YdhG, YjbR/CyaY-like superfamily, DUF1801 family [Methanolobus vulcani]|uniref:Uncharacterized conserved protein YdhG, YjbR/CyaY-like superfamily, DUF1801 family n=1 Tax=Methanolobus vulcani TaxID=38026 RepID=A0A7Z7AYN1_9EURY|nr:DUF1801 domain-containing protein [Methanolobus vulcani]SDG16523.1 Uncharacterized conserved protein YdhG, YjbR/CyaY-like superfamily, DUF1801 family [Methanolobus vulcani]